MGGDRRDERIDGAEVQLIRCRLDQLPVNGEPHKVGLCLGQKPVEVVDRIPAGFDRAQRAEAETNQRRRRRAAPGLASQRERREYQKEEQPQAADALIEDSQPHETEEIGNPFGYYRAAVYPDARVTEARSRLPRMRPPRAELLGYRCSFLADAPQPAAELVGQAT